MMRDVCARFKYSDREVVAHLAASVPFDASPRAMRLPEQRRASCCDVPMSRTAPSSAIPTELPAPTNCPSRELVHKSLRRYYQDLETRNVSLESVSDRMLDDLAPFPVLKLGGFALGDLSAHLLAAVLVKATSLRTLDLGFNRISDDGAALLASALERNTSLESLYLSGNDIGPAGVQALATALTRNCTLKTLHLSGNNVGVQGAAYLAQGLVRNTGLRSLHIGTNRIGSAGMKALAAALLENQRLKELTLGQNGLGSEGLHYLSRAFATGRVSLTTLELGTNEIGPEGVITLAQALCGAPNRLQNLYMDNNPLGDMGASACGALLSKTMFLRVLDLSYTQMSLMGLRELCSGLLYSTSLLCLLLDGNDWTNTQHMKQSNGVSLSSKGAATFAASCVIGAVTSNVHSVLCKLNGVELSFGLDDLPLCDPDRERLIAETSFARMTRPLDSLARNERVLQFLRDIKTATHPHKRKSDASLQDLEPHDPEMAPPRLQRQRTLADDDSLRFPSMATTAPTTWRATAGPSQASGPSGTPVLRVSLPHSASLHMPQGWSPSSPRYDTLEVHARKVLAEIARMPYDADESDMLQTYYLGGCTSPKPGDEHPHGDGSNCSMESLHGHSADSVPCPACQASRLARYRRTMVVKHQLERMDDPDGRQLVLLRQLHYLINAFSHAENADERVDALLTSMYEGCM